MSRFLGKYRSWRADVRDTVFHVVQVWKVLEYQQRYRWGRLGWVMLTQMWVGVEDRAEVIETGSLLEGFLNHGKETFSLKIPK